MTEQKAKVVDNLSHIVRNLDQMDGLFPIVVGLGRRHRGYGVEERDYDRVRGRALGAIGPALGDELTPDVRSAWEEAYTFNCERDEARGGDHGPASVPVDLDGLT